MEALPTLKELVRRLHPEDAADCKQSCAGQHTSPRCMFDTPLQHHPPSAFRDFSN
jgi:hypothetical protein